MSQDRLFMIHWREGGSMLFEGSRTAQEARNFPIKSIPDTDQGEKDRVKGIVDRIVHLFFFL